MIPLKLRMQDFMSYAELDLDLRGIHSAVLSGANGAGKSTLLDAITWALWDRARSGSEELIRLGQPEMWVELEFEMDGQTYRVWRRRTRKKGVQTQLHFQQQVEGEDFVSLDGATLRETQGRINGVLRMGYDTFVNSAFILQGRADQFTTKTPRERKALLGEILGLQHYDDLAQKARDRWKAAQLRADQLEHEQAEVRTLLETRQETQTNLELAREAAASLRLHLDQAEERRTRLLAEEATLKAARDEIAAGEAARDKALADRDRVDAEIAAHAAKMEASQAAVARRTELEADHETYQALVAADRLHRERADAAHAVERRLADARAAATRAQHAHTLLIQKLEAEADAAAKERASHEEVLADRERIEAGRRQLEAARQAEAAFQERARQHRTLEERRGAIDLATERAKVAYEAAKRDHDQRLARARETAAKLPALQAEVDGVRAELEALAGVAKEQDAVKEQGFGFRAAKERAEAGAQTAVANRKALEAKLAQLMVDLEIHAGGPRTLRIDRSHACPLCQTELEGEQLEAIIRQYRLDIRALEAEAARLEDEAAEAERRRLDAGVRYKALNAKLSQREATQEKLGQLRQQLATFETAADEVQALEANPPALALAPELEAEKAEIQQALAALGHDPAGMSALQQELDGLRWVEARGWKLDAGLGAIAKLDARQPELDAELADRRREAQRDAELDAERQEALQAELAATGHDPAAMADVRARLADLAQVPAAFADLQKQLQWLESAATLHARLENERSQLTIRSLELNEAMSAARRKLERQPFWENETAAVTMELERLRQESSKRYEELGKLEAELTRLDELDARLAGKKAEWNSAIDESQTFKELSEAFGKNGIQALMIENALPELEEEANRLLARITDNRMHVRLATQREKKTGGAAETLEIYISDEVGTRNYEMYSGGEAFRVNFALRLALSRLLARRAGARLQTLVIDEGFGTQDEKGRERLVEAINAVSNEFERILVITHVRELKDAFNTHIEVVKRGGVSEIRLPA